MSVLAHCFVESDSSNPYLKKTLTVCDQCCLYCIASCPACLGPGQQVIKEMYFCVSDEINLIVFCCDCMIEGILTFKKKTFLRGKYTYKHKDCYIHIYIYIYIYIYILLDLKQSINQLCLVLRCAGLFLCVSVQFFLGWWGVVFY